MLNPIILQRNRLTLLLLGLLEHLLDDLLLLDQESTDNAVLNAVGASRSAVSALDGLLGAGNLGVLAGAEGGDTLELGTTVTALGGSALLLDVQVTELTTGSPDNADLLALGVVWRTSPVGESVGRHRDRFPGESVGNCLSHWGAVSLEIGRAHV